MKKVSISHPPVGQFDTGVPRLAMSKDVTFPCNELGIEDRYEIR